MHDTIMSMQSSSDLSSTIRGAILVDPRASQLTSSQIDAIATALARNASSRGITATDILWRPMLPAPVSSGQTLSASQSTFGSGLYEASASVDYCAQSSPMSMFVCNINRAAGLPGTDARIPITFGVVGIILLAIAAFVIEMRHRSESRTSH